MKNLLIAFSFVVCMGCQPDAGDTVCTASNTVRLPDELISRFVFKKGSYWIYEDSLTHVTDSIWVSGNKQTNPTLHELTGSDENKCYERVDITFQSSYYHTADNKQEPWFTKIAIQPYAKTGFDFASEHFLLWEVVSSSLFSFSSSVYRFNYFNASGYDSPSFGGTEINFLSFFEVQGVTFADVLHYFYPIWDDQIHDYLREAHYAKHVGLIRFMRRDGSVWLLKKYEVNQ